VCTGLLLRSLDAVVHADPGFRADHLLAIEDAHAGQAGSAQANVEFYRELLARLRQLPGVQGASAAFELPLHGTFWTSPYVPSGHAQALNTQEPWTEINIVMPGYFQTMGIHLLGGRYLADTDDAGSAPVAVINEAMAHTLGPADPTGRAIYVEYAPHASMRVVGIVADVKQFGLDRKAMPEVFIPAPQAPLPALNIVLRTSGDPDALIHAAAAAVHDFDKNEALPRAVAMEAWLDAGMGDRRFVGMLLGIFDALAVLLAVIGVVGVVSYSVEQRTQEIGVRMALGAKRSDVMRMIVLKQTGRIALFGMAAGVVLALGMSRLLASQLYGVTKTDPVTYVVASLMLLIIVLLASSVPALRAMKVDPMVALRCE